MGSVTKYGTTLIVLLNTLFGVSKPMTTLCHIDSLFIFIKEHLKILAFLSLRPTH